MTIGPDTLETILGASGPRTRFADRVDARRSEFEAVRALLLENRGSEAPEVEEVAAAIAAGSLGDQHLWRDMGLRDRAEVRALFEAYFEPFAADNTKDMRWKRFIYKRLCGWEGFHA